MSEPTTPGIGYVLKMYPRFSQTFVVNELLAHQAAGRPVDIFSLRLPNDSRFHESISRVQSRVARIPVPNGRAGSLLDTIQRTATRFPDVWQVIGDNPSVHAGDLQQSMELALRARQFGVSHLHAHFGTVATTTARLAARIAGRTYSFTAHAKDIFHESVDHETLRAKLADAAAVITVSDYNKRYLKDRFGRDADHVVHINNGLNLEEFDFSAPTDRSRLILGVGRLVEKKGFSVLVQACARLRDNGRDFQCEIAGSGALAGSLQRQIRDLRLERHVSLIGPQPQKIIKRKLRQAGVLAAPCVVASDQDRDGLPTILLEAMATGTPCVSTDVTGIPEVLIHDKTGLQVPQNDAVALAEACGSLLDSPARGERLARTARALVEDSFDIRINAGRIRRLFDEIVANQGDAGQSPPCAG